MIRLRSVYSPDRAHAVAARSATSARLQRRRISGAARSTPDVSFECELARQVELQPGVGVAARSFLRQTAYTMPDGHKQDHPRRQFEPSSSDGDQPRRILNVLAVELREQLEPRRDVGFGRQAEDPAARAVLHEGSSNFAIDLEVEHLYRDFSGHQELG